VKPFAFSTPASEELGSAILWYETRRSGLGSEFYDAVSSTIERIRTHPEIGTIRAGRFRHRRVQVLGFPYTVVYRVREDDIYVVAIAHSSRRPDYWKNRG
jgi:toxin ParE1/3/4